VRQLSREHLDAHGILASLACASSQCECQASLRRGKGNTHCPCHDDRTPSLKVDPASGADALVHCFAGCDQTTVWQACLEAVQARPTQSPKRSMNKGQSGDSNGARAPRSEDWIASLWRETQRDPGRIAAYLRHRGLSGEVPPTLRFHPALPYSENGEHPSVRYPAMVAPFRTVEGKLIGVHRTWLDPEGPGKAPVTTAKKFAGEVRSASIHLGEPSDSELDVAEGIESGLAVQEAADRPVWVAGSASGLANLELPPGLRRLRVWADADDAGLERGAHLLAERASAQGLEVFVLAPPTGDWLDVQVAEGEEALRRAEEKAQLWIPAKLSRTPDDVDGFLASLPDGEPCPRMLEERQRGYDACQGASCHGAVSQRVLAIIRDGERGHPGTRDVLDGLCAAFARTVTRDRREGEDEGGREFDRMVEEAAAIVAGSPSRESDRGCLCGQVDAGGMSDAHLADTATTAVLRGSWCWPAGLGWLRWDGRRWQGVPDEAVHEEVRQYLLGRYREAMEAIQKLKIRLANLEAQQAMAKAEGDAASSKMPEIEKLGKRARGAERKAHEWYATLSRNRIDAISALARGILLRDATKFDARPELLNVRNAVLHLRTGQLQAHDPELLLTKLAPVNYVPGFKHQDWDKALEAVPEDVRDWYQERLGQAATGYPPPDDLLLVQVGSGENGKTTLMGGVTATLGDYSVHVGDRVLLADRSAHTTEFMDLRGARLALIEETPEERRLSVRALKQIVGTPKITARRMRQDPVTFETTHALFVSTNYLPIVEESDHGTWRRLACLRYPYRFRKPHERLEGPLDRSGDPGLRERVQEGEEGQHKAALVWLAEGARRWYEAHRKMTPPPARIVRDTREWRKQADLILAYVEDRLIWALTQHVISQELLEDFTTWLVTRGHRPWSLETFVARFGAHSEVTGHQVVKKVVRRSAKLSQRIPPPGEVEMPAPKLYHAWLGIRFRTDDDPLEDPDQAPNLSYQPPPLAERTDVSFQGDLYTNVTTVTAKSGERSFESLDPPTRERPTTPVTGVTFASPASSRETQPGQPPDDPNRVLADRAFRRLAESGPTEYEVLARSLSVDYIALVAAVRGDSRFRLTRDGRCLEARHE